MCESCSVVSDSLGPHGLFSPWNSPGQNTGVGCHSLLQGIFPTQRSNPDLLHCRRILHQGSPRILEWVAYPFSSKSSRPRNRTGVFCMAGRFFTNWAIREAKQETWVQSLGREDPRLSTPVLLPGKFHGQRSLAGYSPWGRKKSNMMEWVNNKKYKIDNQQGPAV